MIIEISELGRGKKHFRIKDDDWFPHEAMNLVYLADGVLTIEQASSSGAKVTAECEVEVEMPCHRCGQTTRLTLSGGFTYDCIVGKEEPHHQQEVECGEDDINKIYLEEPFINAGELLREQVLLAMPIRVVCKQSCKGLCLHCGADLNNEACNCENTGSLSPFTVLKRVKGR